MLYIYIRTQSFTEYILYIYKITSSCHDDNSISVFRYASEMSAFIGLYTIFVHIPFKQEVSEISFLHLQNRPSSKPQILIMLYLFRSTQEYILFELSCLILFVYKHINKQIRDGSTCLVSKKSLRRLWVLNNSNAR